MKRISILLSLTVASLLAFAFTQAVTPMYLLNASASSINWTSKGDTPHTGTFKFKSGNIKVDKKIIRGGFFYINMNAIKVSDISDEGFNEQERERMRAEDYLDIAKHKDATFKITKAVRKDVAEGEPNVDITGEFTMKGKKEVISFPSVVDFGKKNTSLKATILLKKDVWEMPEDLELSIDVQTNLKK